MEKQDIAVFLETGVNDDKHTPSIHDDFEVIKENKMAIISQAKKPNVGAGTAINVRKGIKT